MKYTDTEILDWICENFTSIQKYDEGAWFKIVSSGGWVKPSPPHATLRSLAEAFLSGKEKESNNHE